MAEAAVTFGRYEHHPAREHDKYPLLILGFRDGEVRCLDCAPGGPIDGVLLAGDEEGETASCSDCGRPLRRATRFGELSEADLSSALEQEDEHHPATPEL